MKTTTPTLNDSGPRQTPAPPNPYGTPRERALVFLAEYGEKGRLLLEAALEAWRRAQSNPRPPLGDFDYKTLVQVLEEKGHKYRPNQLLRRLEREYDLIETSYKSSRQHWWVFRDRSAIEEALLQTPTTATPPHPPSTQHPPTPQADPLTIALKIQYTTLEPHKLLNQLEHYLNQPTLTQLEKQRLKTLLTTQIEQAAQLLNKMTQHDPQTLQQEIQTLQTILQKALQTTQKHFNNT